MLAVRITPSGASSAQSPTAIVDTTAAPRTMSTARSFVNDARVVASTLPARAWTSMSEVVGATPTEQTPRIEGLVLCVTAG